jgi:hypothetical protein
MNITTLRPDTLERMVRAVERVKEQLAKATKALEAGGVPYAVIGGNAVAAWVSQVDEGATRATRDVDVLIRREDLEAAKTAMAVAGFEHAQVTGVDLFIEGPTGKPSQGVHLLFAGERVNPADATPAPLVEDSVQVEGVAYRVLSVESLVRMKLVANRDKDRTHVRDLIGVGLIDATWPARYPAVLAERLQSMLDTPGG